MLVSGMLAFTVYYSHSCYTNSKLIDSGFNPSDIGFDPSDITLKSVDLGPNV